ncbi:MAG: hypothetical protein PHP50_06380 [Lachnospiraceae bacterium]|nr:hypothetical protein [Lachnospiraceae bacterium]
MSKVQFMKKAAVLMIGAVMLFSISSCGRSTADDSGTNASGIAEDTKFETYNFSETVSEEVGKSN